MLSVKSVVLGDFAKSERSGQSLIFQICKEVLCDKVRVWVIFRDQDKGYF